MTIGVTHHGAVFEVDTIAEAWRLSAALARMREALDDSVNAHRLMIEMRATDMKTAHERRYMRHQRAHADRMTRDPERFANYLV